MSGRTLDRLHSAILPKAMEATMSASTILNPHDPDFEKFLYATVGDDHGGRSVSVLSVLARLKLDPWDEAASLGALSRDAAVQRLSQLLARCIDIPSLRQDHHAIAKKLASLLPNRRLSQGESIQITQNRPSVSWGTVLAIIVFLFFLVRLFFTGEAGSGE
ncbi:hypothetical protein GCM10011363_27130 [Marivita lacus]|uniref:Uncharacterized protein n=2 Tax=Marivita lacus TaxID=1323742 RepID=A0ABQ1KWF4_9RHOB|nr:hypothetical protein GCM10011363_27130 [Marivita lacus]